MRKTIIALSVLLGACSSTQFNDAENQANAALNAVSQACAGAQTAETTAQSVAQGGAANTVANLSSYVNSACSTSAAIIAIAQNPGTVAWLNQLVADFNAAIGGGTATTSAS